MNKQQKPPQPPLWADKLLEWLCADELLEEVQDNLQELFEKREAGQEREHTGCISCGLWFKIRMN